MTLRLFSSVAAKPPSSMDFHGSTKATLNTRSVEERDTDPKEDTVVGVVGDDGNDAEDGEDLELAEEGTKMTDWMSLRTMMLRRAWTASLIRS